MIKKTKGFTLIELLVVIAIIGILSSVVLASLNSARNKGADAAAKSNLNNARAQAELFYDSNNNSYDTVCTAATGIVNNVTAASNAVTATASCADLVTAWAAEIQLNGGGFYCADSRGVATTSSATFSLADTSTSTAACI